MLLELDDVETFYGDFQALYGVSFEVEEEGVVGLIGPNGAGKSTTLETITGLLEPRSGSIKFKGQRIDGASAEKIAKMGMALVPEGRWVWTGLSVEDNLLLGSYIREGGEERKERMEWVFSLFPRLKERRGQKAGTLSGGEQQMLVIGRALMLDPSLLIIDEVSLGLMPVIVDKIYEMLEEIQSRGVALLLVEQSLWRVLEMAQKLYVMREGKVIREFSRDEFDEEEISNAYFGAKEEGGG